MMFPRAYQRRALTVVVLVASLLGCGGRKEEFIGGRALDRCNQTWPVCDTVAGCLIGEQSYLEGRFPGDGRFIVKLAEPSTVRVSMFIENVGASGEEMVVIWYEDRCRARIRKAVGGRTFIEEAERTGAFVREADLTGLGDHLIEFHSDAQVDYTLKVDVIPRRAGDPGGE